MSEVEKIAASLTDEQRAAIIKGTWNVSAMAKQFRKLGLVETGARYSVLLTPDGLAVRDALKREVGR